MPEISRKSGMLVIKRTASEKKAQNKRKMSDTVVIDRLKATVETLRSHNASLKDELALHRSLLLSLVDSQAKGVRDKLACCEEFETSLGILRGVKNDSNTIR